MITTVCSLDRQSTMLWPIWEELAQKSWRTSMERLGSNGNTSTKRTLPVYGELSCYKPCSQKHSPFHGLTCFFIFLFHLFQRILARAGYDPRATIGHFQSSVAGLHEIQPDDKADNNTLTGAAFKLWTKATHPSAEQRTDAIRKEIDRWQEEAKKVAQM